MNDTVENITIPVIEEIISNAAELKVEIIQNQTLLSANITEIVTNDTLNQSNNTSPISEKNITDIIQIV